MVAVIAVSSLFIPDAHLAQLLWLLPVAVVRHND